MVLSRPIGQEAQRCPSYSFPIFCEQIAEFGKLLDRRTRPRFWYIFFGLLMCREKRRTASASFRAAEIGDDFHRAYETIGSVGRRISALAVGILSLAEHPSATAGDERLVLVLDDTPTKRYGPEVQGAVVHHNPTPGPARQDHVYGHDWVTLARVVRHPRWNTIALPLRSELYVREKNLPAIPAKYGWEFRIKLEQAIQLIDWLRVWLAAKGKPIWLLADGAYAKSPVLKAAKRAGVFLVSRLRCGVADPSRSRGTSEEQTGTQADLRRPSDQPGEASGGDGRLDHGRSRGLRTD